MAQVGYVQIDLNPYYDTRCWGCGSQLVPSSTQHVFLKCTWCGAITDQNQHQHETNSKSITKFRRLRGCSLVTYSLLFMLGVICAGVWAVLPLVSSFSYACRLFHCVVTAALSVVTLFSFYLASTTPAGEPSNMPWGDHQLVGKDGLDYCTFCTHCSKPKPPGTQHCDSCNKCVLDRHSHSPFIGNCIGAANFPHFITLLIAVMVSCSYIAVITSCAAVHHWPALDMKHIIANAIFNKNDATEALTEIISGFAGSAFLSPRINVLIYLLLMSIVFGSNVTWFLVEQVLDLGCDGQTIVYHIFSYCRGLCSRASPKLGSNIGCHHSSVRIMNYSIAGKR